MNARVVAAGTPRPLRWFAATAVGYAVALTASSLLVGATSRALSPFAGGIVVVLYFGAVVGVILGAVQLLALPRAAVRWPVWIGASLVAMAIGYAVASIVGELLGNAIDPFVNVIVGEGIIEDLSGAVIGIALAYAQWRVLRPVVGARSWIVATAIGAALGYGIASAALEVFEIAFLKANMVPSFGAILGIFIGAAQAVVLVRASSATRIDRE